MKVLVSGSSGLIGSALTEYLKEQNYTVLRLVRKGSQDIADGVFWDASEKSIAKESIEGLRAVVHLAGENIASGKWTEEKKAKILTSRVEGTRFLCESLAALKQKPEVLIAASAIGIYGNRGNERLNEKSECGTGFLADVCKQWEAATEPARAAGIRVVNARIGMVLSPKGGALKKMRLPFKLGLGGVLGTGQQVMSWVSIEDVVRAAEFCIRMINIRGPVNFVAPQPVTNRDFTKALGCALRRPTLFPMPAGMAHMLFGDMADELLLSSTAVYPDTLNQFSYTFKHFDLFWTLKAMV